MWLFLVKKVRVMIVVRLEGGLGNQLFQYAFGKALSVKHGVPLCFDIRSFNNWKANQYVTQRDYNLNVFPINAIFYGEAEDKVFFPSSSLLSRTLHKVKRMTGLYTRLYETKAGYDESVIGKSLLKSYCIGYWQSYFYFNGVSNLIREELKLDLSKCIRDVNMEDDIKSIQSICIHVRRGDYVQNKITTEVHGVIDIAYYKKAVDVLKNKLGQNLKFYVFSDDPMWCLEAFDWLTSSIIVNSGSNNHPGYDMHLMSLCRHFVIANSTYSWWAAWLAKNPQKIVIVPQQWFVNIGSSQLQMHPPEWITL